MKYNLIQNYFKSNPRHKEYEKCLRKNVENEYISDIYLFCERGTEIPIKDSKIKIVEWSGLPTYEDYFQFCNTKLDGSICILANLDIYYDDTLCAVEDRLTENTVIALSRWEVERNGKITPRYRTDSQDTWIFKTPINFDGLTMNFTLGKPGCDNRIAHELSKKYSIINPALSIKSMHLHLSNFRGMSANIHKNRIPGPYKTLKIIK